MSLKARVAWWTSLMLVGLLGAGWVSFAYQSENVRRQLLSTIEQVSQEKQVLLKENERLRYIQNLAVEFSMEPGIVTVVDYYSRQYVQKDKPEWRLLKTPEFMTYIMLSLIYAESKGDPNAIGDGGKARGLTQIWVSTAREYGDVTAQQLLDAETNISFSFKHFHNLLVKYNGNLAMVLYAWNRGPGTVDKLLSYGQSPENGYARRVYQAALLNNREVLTGN